MTFYDKVRICNACANWYAETNGVDYFGDAPANEVTSYYAEFLEDSKTDVPELKKFFFTEAR